jgi:hypothetical protein
MEPVKKKCRVCGDEKLWPDEFRRDKTSFTRCKECARAYQREWNETHRDLTRAWAQTYRSKRKKRVIDHYGGKCACCGESDIRFLTIDHMSMSGSAHRMSIGMKSGVHFHWWLEKNGLPDGYQVLCFNCNVASFWNNGICPHKEEVT